MNEHPIEQLMHTAMNSIKDMIDVDTIIGDPIQASNNIVIIPVSKVSFGFVAGGSEFNNNSSSKEKDTQMLEKFPFGGGSGAGVSVNPVAFIVVQENIVKLLPVNHVTSLDRVLDYVPDLVEKFKSSTNEPKNELKD